MAKPKLKTPAKRAATKAPEKPKVTTKKVPAKARARKRTLPGWLEGIVGFFRETRAELRKVQWPTLQEALYLTRMVVLVTFLSGLVLGIFDWLFAQLVRIFVVGA